MTIESSMTPNHASAAVAAVAADVSMGSTNPAAAKTLLLPAAMRSQPEPDFIFFTDFDGTITRQDSNDYMTDTYGFGTTKRKGLNQEVMRGSKKFRDCFWEMMESVSRDGGGGDGLGLGFNTCVKVLEDNIALDEGFKAFWEWCKTGGGGGGGEDDDDGRGRKEVPVVVLSGGMRPIILALLGKLLGLGEGERKELEREGMLVSNDVGVREGFKNVDEPGGWEIVFHDESEHGHDKSLELRKYSSLPNRPVMFYAGDGVSDLSAARETDLLFAKEGCDLVTYCERENLPFRTFRDFGDIMVTVKDIVEGRLSIGDAASGRQVWE